MVVPYIFLFPANIPHFVGRIGLTGVIGVYVIGGVFLVKFSKRSLFFLLILTYIENSSKSNIFVESRENI